MLDFRELLYRPDGSKRAMCNMLIIVINLVVFAVLELLGDTQSAQFMYEHGAAFPPAVFAGGEYSRLFTCIFMHFGAAHLFNNMLVLYFLGDNLERAVGKIRYLIIYLGSGVLSSFVSNLVMYHSVDYAVSAGASGAIFGVFGALFFLVLWNRGRMEELTVKRLGLFIVLTLYSGFTAAGVDNCAHVAGLISGFLLALLFGRRKRKGGHRPEDTVCEIEG